MRDCFSPSQLLMVLIFLTSRFHRSWWPADSWWGFHISLVYEPTRGGNVLDRLFVSRSSYTNVKILTSAIKSDQFCNCSYRRQVNNNHNQMFRRPPPKFD